MDFDKARHILEVEPCQVVDVVVLVAVEIAGVAGIRQDRYIQQRRKLHSSAHRGSAVDSGQMVRKGWLEWALVVLRGPVGSETRP